MSENAVTMAANRVTVVAGRVLREPFTARAWRTFVYCFCQPFVDLFGLGVVLLLLTGSTGSAGLLAPVLLVPLLAFARGLGNVHRGLARGLLGWDVPEPLRAPRRPGVLGFFIYYYGRRDRLARGGLRGGQGAAERRVHGRGRVPARAAADAARMAASGAGSSPGRC